MCICHNIVWCVCLLQVKTRLGGGHKLFALLWGGCGWQAASPVTPPPDGMSDYITTVISYNCITNEVSKWGITNPHPRDASGLSYRRAMLEVVGWQEQTRGLLCFGMVDLCTRKHVNITIDNAIQNILNYGEHTILAKVDIKSAFRLVPVHPANRHFLGMRWWKQIYVHSCLPFGLLSAPKLFNILADLVSWIAIQQGISCILHYLDDFLLVGPPQSPVCQQNLETFIHLCSDLGIPLASEKIDGPTTSLAFLGIIIDTHRMEIRLPAEKLARIQDALEKWLTKKSATKRMILSLLGQL